MVKIFPYNLLARLAAEADVDEDVVVGVDEAVVVGVAAHEQT